MSRLQDLLDEGKRYRDNFRTFRDWAWMGYYDRYASNNCGKYEEIIAVAVETLKRISKYEIELSSEDAILCLEQIEKIAGEHD